MSDARYNLVFSGQLIQGADAQTVKANLARVFKIDLAKVETLFSGKPVVLKKNADQATAMKFRAVMKQAGAQCEMKAVAAASQTNETPSAASSPEHSAAQSGDLETVGTIRTGGTGFTGAFSVAAVGDNMNTEQPVAPPSAPDTSHLSLANPGEEPKPLQDNPPSKVPDTGHLSLE